MRFADYMQRHRPVVSALLFITGVVLYLYGSVLSAHPLRTHEWENLYFRVHEYVAELKTHGFPPTLFPNAMLGGGFAFPLFYPPFSNLVAAAVSIVTGTHYFAANFTLFLSVLLSAYASFYAFLKIDSRFSTALTAAILYVTIPYRFVDIFARGALAEAWTFPWMPLIFCGGVLILRGKNRQGFALLSLATCGLLLSHAVMGVYFMLICTLLFLVACVVGKNWSALVYSGLAMVFAAGLGAWYMIPQRAHWHLVAASQEGFMSTSLKAVKAHNVEFSQLFYTDADRWNGDSYKGIGDEMSFELGYANFLLLFVLVGGYLYFRNRRVQLSPSDVVLRWGSVIVWFISIWFVLKTQRFLKDLPDALLYIQFGWRMLGITAFFCVASYVLVVNSYRLNRRMRALLSVVAIAGSLAAVNPAYKAPKYLDNVPDEPLTAEKIKPRGEKGFVILAEYKPRDYPESYNYVLQEGNALAFGDMVITSQSLATEPRVYGVDAQTSSIICLPLLAYPVYEARTESGELKPFSHWGFQAFSGIQPGDKTVTVRRVLSGPQKIGLAVSALTAALFLLCLWAPIWSWQTREEKPAT